MIPLFVYVLLSFHFVCSFVGSFVCSFPYFCWIYSIYIADTHTTHIRHHIYFTHYMIYHGTTHVFKNRMYSVIWDFTIGSFLTHHPMIEHYYYCIQNETRRKKLRGKSNLKLIVNYWIHTQCYRGLAVKIGAFSGCHILKFLPSCDLGTVWRDS